MDNSFEYEEDFIDDEIVDDTKQGNDGCCSSVGSNPYTSDHMEDSKQMNNLSPQNDSNNQIANHITSNRSNH
jgi:hypothetical protein